MGFDCLSCGEWLHRKMTLNYKAWSSKWNLAYDSNIYFPAATQLRAQTTNRVCFYARHSTPRRAVELGFKAFEILAMRGVDFEVDMLGCDLGNIDLPYKYKSYPLLDSAGLAALYRDAAIGMVFSATNHSIMNKEMMACGLPVICTYNTGGSEIVDNGVNGFILPIRDIDLLKKKILILYKDRVLLKKMKHNSYIKAQKFLSWDCYGENIIKFYKKVLAFNK
jgi:glycosyltransferase involved in cell wall biosynthesis